MDFILEAAAQVLEAAGEAGFNTNAVAARAGVSIGTLYRYFPDKAAILRALAMRETEVYRQAVMAILHEGSPGVAPDRAMIRAFIRAFAGRSQARRIAVSALLAHADHGELAAKFETLEHSARDAQGIKRHPDLTPWRHVKLTPLWCWLAAHPRSPQEGPARRGAPPRGWRSGAWEEPVGPRVLSRGGGGLGAGVRHVTASGLSTEGLMSPARRFSRSR